jgi:hypothetical protein
MLDQPSVHVGRSTLWGTNQIKVRETSDGRLVGYFIVRLPTWTFVVFQKSKGTLELLFKIFLVTIHPTLYIGVCRI